MWRKGNQIVQCLRGLLGIHQPQGLVQEQASSAPLWVHRSGAPALPRLAPLFLLSPSHSTLAHVPRYLVFALSTPSVRGCLSLAVGTLPVFHSGRRPGWLREPLPRSPRLWRVSDFVCLKGHHCPSLGQSALDNKGVRGHTTCQEQPGKLWAGLAPEHGRIPRRHLVVAGLLPSAPLPSFPPGSSSPRCAHMPCTPLRVSQLLKPPIMV